MFNVSFTGGGVNAPFYGSFTTNVVATCQSGNFLGLEGDLSYDASLNVSVSGLNGATVSGSGHVVVYFANGVGVKSGTSVLKLSVSNKSLKDGQTANIKFQNVKGVCDGGTSVANATKSVKYVKPAPQPEKPAEPDEPEEPVEPVKTSEELLVEAEERIKTLEAQLQAYEEAPVLGASDETTGFDRMIKWIFFGVGALMTALMAAAIAIIRSLMKHDDEGPKRVKAKAKS